MPAKMAANSFFPPLKASANMHTIAINTIAKTIPRDASMTTPFELLSIALYN